MFLLCYQHVFLVYRSTLTIRNVVKFTVVYKHRCRHKQILKCIKYYFLYKINVLFFFVTTWTMIIYCVTDTDYVFFSLTRDVRASFKTVNTLQMFLWLTLVGWSLKWSIRVLPYWKLQTTYLTFKSFINESAY